METPDRIRSALACQVGTEHYWKVFPDNDAFKITDGVKMMAEMCEAFWLVADILACQHTQKAKREAFQTWTLTLNAKDKSLDALLVKEDDKATCRNPLPWAAQPCAANGNLAA